MMTETINTATGINAALFYFAVPGCANASASDTGPSVFRTFEVSRLDETTNQNRDLL